MSKDFDSAEITLTALKELAEAYGTRVLEILQHCEETVKFCHWYRVGARLRWAIAPDLLEEASDAVAGIDTLPDEVARHDVSPAGGNAVAPATQDTYDPSMDVSTDHRSDEISWLQAELNTSFDPSEAEALVMTIEVIISDDVSAAEWIMENVEEVLLNEGVCEHTVSEFKLRMQATSMSTSGQ